MLENWCNKTFARLLIKCCCASVGGSLISILPCPSLINSWPVIIEVFKRSFGKLSNFLLTTAFNRFKNSPSFLLLFCFESEPECREEICSSSLNIHLITLRDDPRTCRSTM
uniref:Uncharacterized protein n=1 Tax=Saccharomyces cerevisiae TaxID=4932 RepID=E9P9Z0_YEASX|nr:unknown [Saccharomyces cerevisiae]